MSDTVTIGCEEAMRLLAEMLDGELSTGQHRDVDVHLARCRSCYSRAEFERRLKTELATLRQQPVPRELEARIRNMFARITSI